MSTCNTRADTGHTHLTDSTLSWQRDEVCSQWIKAEKEIHLCRYWAVHRSSGGFVSTLQKTDKCFTFFPNALLADGLKAPQMRLFKSTLNAAATTLRTDTACVVEYHLQASLLVSSCPSLVLETSQFVAMWHCVNTTIDLQALLLMLHTCIGVWTWV